MDRIEEHGALEFVSARPIKADTNFNQLIMIMDYDDSKKLTEAITEGGGVSVYDYVKGSNRIFSSVQLEQFLFEVTDMEYEEMEIIVNEMVTERDAL